MSNLIAKLATRRGFEPPDASEPFPSGSRSTSPDPSAESKGFEPELASPLNRRPSVPAALASAEGTTASREGALRAAPPVGSLPKTQHAAALQYAEGLRFVEGLFVPDCTTNWPALTSAIVNQWGTPGLKRVKRLAWELAARREGVLA